MITRKHDTRAATDLALATAQRRVIAAPLRVRGRSDQSGACCGYVSIAARTGDRRVGQSDGPFNASELNGEQSIGSLSPSGGGRGAPRGHRRGSTRRSGQLRWVSGRGPRASPALAYRESAGRCAAAPARKGAVISRKPGHGPAAPRSARAIRCGRGAPRASCGPARRIGIPGPRRNSRTASHPVCPSTDRLARTRSQ